MNLRKVVGGLFVLYASHVMALQLNWSSSTNFYVDFSSDMRSDYIAVAVTNTDGVAYSNLWVTIDSFTNGVLQLGSGETGQYNMGVLAIGQSKPAFFYLQSTNDPGNSGVGYPTRFAIKVFKGYPGLGTLVTSNNFSVNEVTSGQNQANKVSNLFYTPTNNPVVGGIFKLTVQGTTGNVQNGNDMAFTAATFTNWNAGAFQLVACSIVITDSPSYILSNNLDTVSVTHISGNGDPYQAEYWFRAIATTKSNTPVSPVNYLNNGGGTVNHVQESVLLALSPVLPATNQTTLNSVTNFAQLYTNEVVTVTVRVTNASIFDVTLDRFVDNLPSGLVYIGGSSTFGGTAIFDPTNVSQVLTWSQVYSVPAGTSRDFTFQAYATNTISKYFTNSCIGYVQNSQIDTTLDTSDNSPAIEVVRALIAPIAANVSTNVLENQSLNVASPGVLANTTEPNSFAATVISYTQPSHGTVTVSNNGGYIYIPTAFYWGADSFTFTLTNQNGRISTATNNITVNWVNQPPYFTKGTNVTVLENAAAQSIANWATGINQGTNDPAQTLAFQVSNNNSNLFSVQPQISSSGTLTFTPASFASGIATVTVNLQDNGGTANGGNNTSQTQTFTITINAVNQQPYFTKGTNATVLENGGAQTLANWASGISSGTNDPAQGLTFHVSNSSNSLFSVQPSIASNGTLTFTPAPFASGSATVTVYLTDDGGTANGGNDTSVTQTFTVTVNAVNQQPYFTKGTNVTVLENGGAQTLANWASGINSGTNDPTQNLTFHVSNNSNSLFAVQPSVSTNGTLIYTPAPFAYGTATVSVYLTDDGGTANGGNDTSPTQMFTINVNWVNQQPYFTTGADQTVLENSSTQTVSGWATGINSGTNDPTQNLTFHVSNNSNSLFAVQPSVSSNGTLTYTPAANVFGSATVSVYLTDDGGTANGGNDTGATQTFTINVGFVNQQPTLNTISNLTVTENWNQQTVNLSGITPGPASESNQTVIITATSSNPSLIPNPAVNYTNPNSTGSLTFTPATNSFGTSTITVVVQDNGGTANGGVDSVTNTFTVLVQGLTNYWFGGSNLTVNISDATAPGGVSPTNYLGVLSVPASSTNPFTIKIAGPGLNFNSGSNYTWTIATTTRGVIGLTTNQFIFDTTAFTNDLAGGYFKVVLNNDGSSVSLLYIGNNPPTSSPATYPRAYNTNLRIPIQNLLTNYTSDPDGDARILVSLGASTNGSYISMNSLYILFSATNNVSETFQYVIRDARVYRPGDTIYYSTNWITIQVNKPIGYANYISSNGGNVSVKFAGIPGYAYDIERAASPVGPWSVIFTTNAPANGLWIYVDNNPPQPAAFYRTQVH